MTLIRRFQTHIILTLLGLLATASATLYIMEAKNDKLQGEVRHFEIKEKADEFRAQPVVRDRRDILNRM